MFPEVLLPISHLKKELLPPDFTNWFLERNSPGREIEALLDLFCGCTYSTLLSSLGEESLRLYALSGKASSDMESLNLSSLEWYPKMLKLCAFSQPSKGQSGCLQETLGPVIHESALGLHALGSV